MTPPPAPISPAGSYTRTIGPQRTRPLVGVAVALSVLTGLALAGPAPAGAHVSSQEQPPVAAGAPTPVTFSFDHGCDGQPTTYLRVEIPEGVTDVTPQDPAGWTSTSSADELRWDGGSVPSGQEASFTATMTFTVADGTVVHFPTIQGCPTAENAWIQIPDAANPEPQYPAPQIVVGVATDATLSTEAGGDHAGDAPTSADTSPATRVPLESTPVTETGSERSTVGLVMFIGVTAVIVIGAVVLYLRHRPRRGS
jgi:uncharacterized protein YcnI